jgi:hypothetical protein
VTESEQAALVAWADLHRSCAICWWPESDPRRRLEVHHIVGGANRSKGHTERNYLRLCERCHGVYHSGKIHANTPDLNLGILLAAKMECDPDNYDPEFLAWLKAKKHLGVEPQSIPQFYIRERQANTYSWSSRTP